MFICNPCLKKHFNNFGISKSYGKCEQCGDKATCYDIPSKHLELKKKPLTKEDSQWF